MRKAAILGCVLWSLTGCAQTPQAQTQGAKQPGPKPACHAGADAKGIADGFFSFFSDDLNGCL